MCINPVNFVIIAQGPLRGNNIGEIPNFQSLGAVNHASEEELPNFTLIGATCHPCRSEKPKHRPVSKNDTGR